MNREEMHEREIERLKFFKERIDQHRFWWFQMNDYLPGIYAELSDFEWEILVGYFNETEHLGYVGECNIPLMSEMLGFIDGSSLDKIVQLGHYAGWSTLMIGWKLKRMGRTKALFSMDILEDVTEYARKIVEIAGLSEVVSLVVGNSCNMDIMIDAVEYLDEVKMIFVDSSHQYQQTVKELALWLPVLEPGGLIFLHDAGIQAEEFDVTRNGGVKRALDEWRTNHPHEQIIMLNRTTPWPRLIRQDGCGAAIIQRMED